jgi:Pyruvate/2-oxoacid:ferredoxin oxidoreductase delta subunit
LMVKRNIVHIDEAKCNGCGQCIPNCAEGALQIIEGKARIMNDTYCDGLGACLGHCPQDAITIIEREAPEFDEEAVHEHLEALKTRETLACGCPTYQVQELKGSPAGLERVDAPAQLALRHWPIQLNLVPVNAPFLKDADLLLMADCAAVAYPALHQRLLKDRSVLMGCPKFDDVNHYVEKLTEILRNNDVRSLTVAHMEVPCCSALNVIAQRALDASGKMIPTQRLIVSVEGDIKSV